MGPASFDCRRNAVVVCFAVTALLASGGVHAAFAAAGDTHDESIHRARHLQEANHGPFGNTDVVRSSLGLGSSVGKVNVNNAGGRKLMGFYNHGSCGVHITQYQIPEGPNNFYSIEATIQDANGNLIGNIGRTTASAPIDISSQLPYQLVVTTALPGSVPDTDAEPVQFALGAEFWSSNDGQCSVGGYDSGKREMDCGFAC